MTGRPCVLSGYRGVEVIMGAPINIPLLFSSSWFCWVCSVEGVGTGTWEGPEGEERVKKGRTPGESSSLHDPRGGCQKGRMVGS